MIEYKILTTSKEKEIIKKSFFDLFSTVYKKNLDEKLWQHQILNSPYYCTPLFVAMDSHKVVGSALMILHKCLIDGNEYNYFLFTTSAILKEYRSKGIYPELLRLQKEYSKQKNIDFILAFPNKLAYPALKLFARFKDFKKNILVKTSLENINFEKIDNSLVIDKSFFKWRFEHKNYLFYVINDKVIIYKEFGDYYDVLAIYEKKDFPFIIQNTTMEKYKKIIILNSCIKNQNFIEKIDTLNATYFPFNDKIDYSKININLLMSDVF